MKPLYVLTIAFISVIVILAVVYEYVANQWIDAGFRTDDTRLSLLNELHQKAVPLLVTPDPIVIAKRGYRASGYYAFDNMGSNPSGVMVCFKGEVRCIVGPHEACDGSRAISGPGLDRLDPQLRVGMFDMMDVPNNEGAVFHLLVDAATGTYRLEMRISKEAKNSACSNASTFTPMASAQFTVNSQG